MERALSPPAGLAARVYAFKVGDLVALARQRVTRSLILAECQQYYMLSNGHPNREVTELCSAGSARQSS
jgi:hypothetical protein